MYFVISVLPISITSGVLPPASVASNFCRCVSQVWYWTSTVAPGCWVWNCFVAAATTSGQPDCASTCSQTTMLSAAAFFVAPETLVATTAAAETARHRATIRCLLTATSTLGTQEPPAAIVARSGCSCQYQFRNWYLPDAD